MSRWLFDLGNSRLKCAPWATTDADPACDMLEFDHDGTDFAAEWAARIPDRFETAFVASVASPALTAALVDALAQRCDRISLARAQHAFDGLRIAYAEPRRLGVDRFLSMLAARVRGPDPWLLVGVGTALTIDLLDGAGRHRGGRIAPSPALMRQSLHARAPHLPLSGGAYVEFGDDTPNGLAAGCEGAALALIARSLQVAATSLGVAPRLLLHGGGGAALLPHLQEHDVAFAPALVLAGLARWASVVTCE